MAKAASVVLGLVAALHFLFFWLEAVAWGKPSTNKRFGIDAATAETNRVFALNQGVYNLFLVAGLIWALVHPEPNASRQIGLFFCGCVVVAGIVGGLTANKRIFVMQALPAAIGAALLIADTF